MRSVTEFLGYTANDMGIQKTASDFEDNAQTKYCKGPNGEFGFRAKNIGEFVEVVGQSFRTGKYRIVKDIEKDMVGLNMKFRPKTNDYLFY